MLKVLMYHWFYALDPLQLDFEGKFNDRVQQEFSPDIGVLKTLIASSGEIAVVFVSVMAFVWVSYLAIVKFRECQKGQADWGELLVLAAASAVLLVWVSVLIFRAAVFTEVK